MNLTIGDAVDWANQHRSVVSRWAMAEVKGGRLKKRDAQAHTARAEEVWGVVHSLVRSVDAMLREQEFPPIDIPPAEIRSAELWLTEHVKRVEGWAENARRKHRTQELLSKQYRGPTVSKAINEPGPDETWQRERPEYDPKADELEPGDRVIYRSWGLSPEQAQHEVLCARLALAMVRSVREASEAWVQGGTYPVPSIVRKAMP